MTSQTTPAKPAVFLDRDGTILREVPYLSRASKVELLPGVGPGLASLQQAGLLLIVVSNQSGVARGLLDEGNLLASQQETQAQLDEYRVRIDAWYHCPHHPSVGVSPQRRRCHCRKPLDGLLSRAEEDFQIDWEHSAGVGDDVRDLQAFAARDLATVLVATGKGRSAQQKLAEDGKEADLFCAHLGEAAPWILRHANLA
ncbi:MAG: HAD-IIIA family hydrolase [Planctomycetes bacterium]|mgnify:FL=1|jgi:D-glycero-D-manno-heptose 1,7-bisphosphate phosphatase|nr:HAD-IIIA family hydrolase [Planctomycetota bacterium]MBT4028518.1 HAD-IIIA family hydrolase [Planctomycetota bacterium]MBT4559410.1 HAD-IIIA family hydrolase [Planctomycetota bacterium]MBT5101965.1 HAD-IIIA family hydrolase [Planctomycetota bacterium]MBT7319063.1 HAD-IIIA family hydrolase [Planctomycetota bacterium]